MLQGGYIGIRLKFTAIVHCRKLPQGQSTFAKKSDDLRCPVDPVCIEHDLRTTNWQGEIQRAIRCNHPR